MEKLKIYQGSSINDLASIVDVQNVLHNQAERISQYFIANVWLKSIHNESVIIASGSYYLLESASQTA